MKNMNNDNTGIDASAIVKTVAPVITSVIVGAIVSDVLAKITSYAVTNYHRFDSTGDTEMHPTKKETILAEDKVAGTKVESSMANDEVNIQGGSVEASETTATASTAEATASEAGATASRVKAGASDVETKALKLM